MTVLIFLFIFLEAFCYKLPYIELFSEKNGYCLCYSVDAIFESEFASDKVRFS